MVDTTQYAYKRQYRVVFGQPERRVELYTQTGIVSSFTPQGIEQGLIARGTPPNLLGDPLRSPDARTIPQEAYETSEIEFEATIIRSNKSNSGASGERTTLKFKNLNPTNRSILERDGVRVMIFAGYVPNGVDQLIYSGDAVEVDSTRQGQDWVTTVRCKQSAITFKNTIVSLTYPENTTLQQVLQDLITRGDGLSYGVDGVGDLGRLRFTRGISYYGKLDKILDQLCESFNLTWVDNNGKITVRLKEIIKGTEAYNNLYRRVISVNPRNIKEASKISDNTNKSRNTSNRRAGIRFRLFLSTPISSENVIRLEESLPNGVLAGDYLVTSTKYELDSRRGEKWDVIVETEAI